MLFEKSLVFFFHRNYYLWIDSSVLCRNVCLLMGFLCFSLEVLSLERILVFVFRRDSDVWIDSHALCRNCVFFSIEALFIGRILVFFFRRHYHVWIGSSVALWEWLSVWMDSCVFRWKYCPLKGFLCFCSSELLFMNKC